MEAQQGVDIWKITTIVYCSLAVFTFIPVLLAVFKKVKLHPGGSAYDDSLSFTDDQKVRLNQHYSRMQGTLEFWKNRAAKNYRFHVYTLVWTTLISISLPILIQSIGEKDFSKLLMTIISVHSALLIGFHRAFKVDKNYQAFRVAESEFYDMRRDFIDSAYKNREIMDKTIDEYFFNISKLRILARREEIDNTPTVKDSN